MRNYALEIYLTDGSMLTAFGPAGSDGHVAALDMEMNWRRVREIDPANYYTLDDKDIPTGQIADVKVLLGDEH